MRQHRVLTAAVGDAVHLAPVPPGADRVGQLEQRHLALEADDAVQLRDEIERGLIAQAGEVSPHREVTADAVGAQHIEQGGVAGKEELEDQRKADQQRVERLRELQDLLGRPFDVNHVHGIALPPEHGGQVTQSEISLLLKTDQHDRTRRIALARNCCGSGGIRQHSELAHKSSRRMTRVPRVPVSPAERRGQPDILKASLSQCRRHGGPAKSPGQPCARRTLGLPNQRCLDDGDGQGGPRGWSARSLRPRGDAGISHAAGDHTSTPGGVDVWSPAAWLVPASPRGRNDRVVHPRGPPWPSPSSRHRWFGKPRVRRAHGCPGDFAGPPCRRHWLRDAFRMSGCPRRSAGETGTRGTRVVLREDLCASSVCCLIPTGPQRSRANAIRRGRSCWSVSAAGKSRPRLPDAVLRGTATTSTSSTSNGSPKRSSGSRELNPVLIGFSLIFQFYIPRYGGLIQVLRAAGIGCHFTMGGHFPSLSYQPTLELIPELDSVVRFEGEQTLVELVDAVEHGAGLARDSRTRLPPRPGRGDHAAAPLLERPRPPAVSGTKLQAGHRAGQHDHADTRQPGLRPHLLVLLDPHVLSRRAGKDRADPQARGSRARDADAARGARHHDLPVPGR